MARRFKRKNEYIDQIVGDFPKKRNSCCSKYFCSLTTVGAKQLKELNEEQEEQGEKIVGVDTVYRFNDKFFGQWLAMNVPFRTWNDLIEI